MGVNIVRTPLKDRHFAVLGSTVMVDQSTVQHAKLAIIVQTQKVKYQCFKRCGLLWSVHH